MSMKIHVFTMYNAQILEYDVKYSVLSYCCCLFETFENWDYIDIWNFKGFVACCPFIREWMSDLLWQKMVLTTFLRLTVHLVCISIRLNWYCYAYLYCSKNFTRYRQVNVKSHITDMLYKMHFLPFMTCIK